MKRDKRAFLLTGILYTLILIFLLFGYFSTPLPLPAEEGILIDFGDDEQGFGEVEPRPVEKIVKQPETYQAPVQEEVKDESFLTQDFEEAPAVAVKKEKTEKKKEVKEKVIEKKEEPKKEVKKEPVLDKRALWGKNQNSPSESSEGESGKTGNQGKLTGDDNAQNYSLGSGMGNGISFSLKGRSAVVLSEPKSDHQEEGRVVVEVTVDRTGKIIKAVPGVKGSTTVNSQLLAIARKAALSSRFNSKNDAPNLQVGTITYVFRLK